MDYHLSSKSGRNGGPIILKRTVYILTINKFSTHTTFFSLLFEQPSYKSVELDKPNFGASWRQSLLVNNH